MPKEEPERTLGEIIRQGMQEALDRGELNLVKVDSLNCKVHPDSEGFIKTSPLIRGHLDKYICVRCVIEETPSPTVAYECPECGFVHGMPEREFYRSSKSQGYTYFCRKCHAKVGSSVTGVFD